jgi:putative thioredoxin
MTAYEGSGRAQAGQWAHGKMARMSSQSFSRPGAVDLSALGAAARSGPAGATAGPGTGAPYAVEVTDTTFEQQVLNASLTAPVVLLFWAPSSSPAVQLKDLLTRLSSEYEGRFALATVDVHTFPQLAASAQVQQVPLVLGVLRGQALPLFADPPPEPQVRQLLDELLKVAVSNGITSRAEARSAPSAAGATPAEPPHDPRYDEAYDAIERGDLEAARRAYDKILADAPGDPDAKAGLAQVGLLRRTQDLDPSTVRAQAASRPDDVGAQSVAADLDVLSGQVDEAFQRLVDTVARTTGADRDRARTHLLELFEVIGTDDPRVAKARSALARVLF